LDKATDDCKLVNHRESLVNARSTDFRQLDKIKKDFAPYCKVWFYARDFFAHSPGWMGGTLGDLDRDAISEEV